MSEAHEVYLIDGGRPVPRRATSSLRVVSVPRLVRRGDAIVAIEPGVSAADAMAERVRRLVDLVDRVRPDALLFDIYPFSKWEVDAEITAMIDAARRANPRVRIVSSLRDVVPRTRHEIAPHGPYEAGVLERLHRFDAILSHGDPDFARVEDYFGRAADISVPISYTGFVVEPPTAPADGPRPGSYAVLSCGGNAKSRVFLLNAIEAYRRLLAQGALGDLPLYVFPSPDAAEDERAALADATARGPFHLREFTPEFDGWLAGSKLSISRGGYNTSVQVLHARVRAVLVPNPDNTDQTPRARRFAKLGIASVIEAADPPVDALALAFEEAMARPPAAHDLDLDGIGETRRLLEAMVPGAAR
jgi:predicted glycosyltransferase